MISQVILAALADDGGMMCVRVRVGARGRMCVCVYVDNEDKTLVMLKW